ncbi:MAG: hypothetical protein Salg2KO_15320 [Salibacteraceae bacterium]
MKKYIVKLIFAVTSETKSVDQVDEQWRVVWANNAKEAKEKSLEIGKAETESFFRTDGERIAWRYVATTDIFELSSLKDGETIFSFSPEVYDAESYLNQIMIRSNQELSQIQ